ncbi:hypothetical protein JCM8115_002915 [Rhodotorula mucilaginosa]|uniref:intramembrane prenyl-peptidase Rce1 n=1 Tax=Rhodotorula mucilaginosa TaxID=5537 RepID=A0A9P7B1V0_RHOMI|nr:hypothetical protein C6P46_002209 [Rhodotorula mucilaginosa]TKA51675.1 hypothetical protein B0A53_05380 [Rhodotorula sp. CCFEE 5036]
MPAGLLSPTSVLLCSTGFTSAYLGSIYLLPSTRIALPPVPPPPSSALSAEDADPIAGTEANPPRDRNHPAVIRARLVAVSVASLASCASLPLLLTHNDPFTYPTWRTAAPTALRLLGLGTRPAVKLILYPLGLTASLFAGSLYISWLAGELPGQRGARTWADWRAKFDGWRGIRTYILGPLTEEITFRSCIMTVSALAGWSPVKLVFLTPLWFGIAHVHHAWETYVAGGRTRQALLRGTLQSTFQFAYTTIFGWYAAFLFLRTGSILPPFLAHVFCNIMGIPPLGWALQVWPDKKKSLYAAYLAGISTFIYGFWRWTAPTLLFSPGSVPATAAKWAYLAAVRS